MKRPRYSEIIETRSISEHPSSTGNVCIKITDKEGGIANIRIRGDTWKKAEFLISGQRIVSIDRIMDVNTFSITDNGFCIPFAQYHDMAIWIEGVDDTVI